MAFYRTTILFLSLMVLVGCSSTHRAYLETIKLAFQTSADPVLTLSEIQNSAIDLLYVSLKDKPRAVLALAYIENSQYKWVSGDNAMLVEQGGRIVKTVGTIDNFFYVTNIENDPLAIPKNVNSTLYWNRSVDYDNGLSAFVESKFEWVINSELIIDGNHAKANMLKEVVTFHQVNKQTNTWINYFWFDTETEQLLKSEQQLTPNSDRYELTYISRIARLPLATVLSVGD
ncbi:YjbF family lipoprotein [Paraglaciecola marina]|uniref:YjbF family lipoprotein n=1 Tax=Paraglaciecola marina TaxID=2500157 RepID=UPI00105B2442|nr:YjbF family lipoprotein [Paraglaciecola marina]